MPMIHPSVLEGLYAKEAMVKALEEYNHKLLNAGYKLKEGGQCPDSWSVWVYHEYEDLFDNACLDHLYFPGDRVWGIPDGAILPTWIKSIENL